MTPLIRQSNLRRTLVAAAVLALFGPAFAEGGDAQGSVTVGAGVANGDRADRALFGQYNGLRARDTYGLVDVEYSRRSEAGAWVDFQGTNLGLETRELMFLWKRQGDWKFGADYGELVRRDPYTINTGLLGAGSTTPRISRLAGGPGSGVDLDLKTKRKGLGITFAKWFTPALELEVNLKSENKEGARLFGIGINCPSPVAPGCGPTTGANAGSAVLLLPEPIKSNHSQLEARLHYAGERLRVSAGYYGSLYDNSYGTMNPAVNGNLNNPLGTPLPPNAGLQSILGLPVALPPDNQAHQFDVTGNYVFAPTTRANFKFAYTRATQDADFAGSGLSGAPAGVSSLDGKVETTLALIGLTSRPIPRLSLAAELRYEDKDDGTPLAQYNVEGAARYTNRNYSRTTTRGKLRASYQFNGDVQGTLGADYEEIDRADFNASSKVSGISALRLRTEETGWRAELRRRMSESFSGSVSYVASRRDGSNWLRPNSGTGVTEVADPSTGFDSTAVFAPNLADRRRDKIRALASWQPTEALSLQFSAEDGNDKFTPPSQYGLRKTRMNLYGADWNLAVTDEWSVNGYVSHGKQTLAQLRPAGYILAFDSTSTSGGAGIVGKPFESLELGGGVSYISDRNRYLQSLDAGAHPATVALLAAAGGLPDITYRRSEFRLYGKYALAKTSSLRLDAVHQRAKSNDWGYEYNGVPFTFSDNSTVTRQQLQNVTFVGVTYTYTWQ